MNKRHLALVALAVIATIAAKVLHASSEKREPIEYYKGHTHLNGGTQGAPEHSGGTDRNGCHNASVPYHCH